MRVLSVSLLVLFIFWGALSTLSGSALASSHLSSTPLRPGSLEQQQLQLQQRLQQRAEAEEYVLRNLKNKRAENDTEEEDPLAEIMELVDLNNDTLVDPEEFHEWFAIVFPVLIEEEEGGHVHRRSAPKPPKMTSANVARLQLAMGRAQPESKNVDKRAPGDPAHVHDCPLDEELFAEFDLDVSGFLNSTEVSAVSMEMMVLVLSGCNEEHSDEHSDECSDPDEWAYWLAGLGSTLLVCLLSLVGIVLLPCMGRKHQGWQALMMMSMIGFAAGALFGDAIFHILPSIFGAHSHDHGSEGHGGHGGHEEEEEEEDDKEYLGLAALVLVGVLLFFIIEKVVLFFIGEAHSHGGGMHDDDESDDDVSKSEDDTDGDDEKKKGSEMEEKSSDEESSPSGSRIGLVVGKLQHSCKHSYENMKEVGGGSVILGGARQVKTASLNSVKRLKFAKSYGWLNLVADAFHNFIDGIAIGASYSQGLSLGISTTLAIIFHEIPQELGDFAMIVRAGFGRVFALAFNLFSACLAFLGCLIGLGVGEAASDGEKWILAFTAGGFLYISLANMVPELHGYRKKRHWLGLVYTALQLSGFILGAGILLIIAAFEEDISIDC